MWPWGHAASGFLVFVVVATVLDDQRYGLPVLAVLVGTQLPDVIDKPLAWTVSLLPAGRSLAHSLVVMVPLLLGLVFVASHRSGYRREFVAAYGFVIGYLTHLFGDGLYPLLDATYADLSFLAWPLLALPAYDTQQSFVAHFQQLELTGTVLFEFALVGLALAVWASLKARRRDFPRRDIQGS